MKNVGILGGSRFIGYHLAQDLVRRGHKVTLFNRGQTPLPKPLDVNRVYGDRDDPKSLLPFFEERFDVVFDLSGYTPEQVQPILAQHRSKIGHYVFCSTSSVYAVPPPSPYTEDSPQARSCSYGMNKALVENLLSELWDQHGFPMTILRPQGVFGPYDAAHSGYVFSRLLHGLPVLIPSGNTARINFLYVSDLVNAFHEVMENSLSHGKIYNVAGDDVASIAQFIELCGGVMGDGRAHPKTIPIDTAKNQGVGLSWLEYDLVADNSRIKNDLNLRFTPLKATLEETCSWLLLDQTASSPRFSRGEKYLLSEKPIPLWAKAYWKFGDLTGLARLKNKLQRPWFNRS